jgi:hypothetical protein
MASVLASVCAGATLPLMNIIFGKIRHTVYVQEETYLSVSSTNGQKLQRDCSEISITRGIAVLHVRYQSIRVSKMRSDYRHEVDLTRLYIVCLFIGRVFLAYVAIVSQTRSP